MRVDQQTAALVFEPSDVVEPFSIVAVGFVQVARADFAAESVLANLAQFGLDGLGLHCIALRYVDLKTVEAIPDRAHDFVFSWHYGFS